MRVAYWRHITTLHWLTDSLTTLSLLHQPTADDSDPGRFVWVNVTSVFFGSDLCYCMRGFSDTHIDQSKVVFIDWELLRADVFLQSRGIGALKDQRHEMIRIFFFYIISKTWTKITGQLQHNWSNYPSCQTLVYQITEYCSSSCNRLTPPHTHTQLQLKTKQDLV